MFERWLEVRPAGGLAEVLALKENGESRMHPQFWFEQFSGG